ncbi:MAG: M20/M25/M40 family metallo-hydrolase [Chloroflexota bacterium]
MSWSASELRRFSEKVLLARQAAIEEHPLRGTTGLELEWNLLDARLQPLQTVGTGPARRSFADVLREDFLPEWLAERTQLEVYHWMIEWNTRPYYSPQLAIYEARLLEACLLNALARAGRVFGERLYACHGNLLSVVSVDHASIPGGWNLAKRRYLETCVDLFGANLATAGIHVNLSLPEPLLSWDFMHLSPSQRDNGHLDGYKNHVYIEGTRLLRAFASLFIAITASTPLQAEVRNGQPVVVLTPFDSVRSLTFPNPESIDLPDLYRSHADYLRLSYDLVRRGIRFGNNNWTPTRARSFAEPVERLISISSDQLTTLYRSGLYAIGEVASLEEMARQIVMQNLRARIDLPMARVEIRTDEGGHTLELDVANLAFKELLLLRLYGDPEHGRAFRYDAEDIARARRNERLAAQHGLRAEIEDPFSAKPLLMREFLRRTLADVLPLAEALDMHTLLAPLVDMATGAPNTAEGIRARLRAELGAEEVVPVELLIHLAEEREQQVAADIEQIAAELPALGDPAARLRDLWGRARDQARHEPSAPIRFRPAAGARIELTFPDKTTEIVELARQLIRIPSVSGAPPQGQRLGEVRRAATFVFDYLRQAGLEVRSYEAGPYPAVLACFPGQVLPPVLLCGHFDVVEPDPDDSQFEPRLDGDYLCGRGACDMKTVVATYLTWMKDVTRRGSPYPAVGLLLVGNEEIGEVEPSGSPHVLHEMEQEAGALPGLLIAGERTGERGDERFGSICPENRGILRVELHARGGRGHAAFTADSAEVSTRLFRARDELLRRISACLDTQADGAWRSTVNFPFARVGEPGLFNITPDRGVLGLEVRTLPGDDVGQILREIEGYCQEAGFEAKVVAAENGIACDRANPYLQHLLQAVRRASGSEPTIGRKLAATSARFAPGGQGVVWGQSGIGPHAAGERHFLPSIEPYYRALEALASCLLVGPGLPTEVEAVRHRSARQ